MLGRVPEPTISPSRVPEPLISPYGIMVLKATRKGHPVETTRIREEDTTYIGTQLVSFTAETLELSSKKEEFPSNGDWSE